MAMTGACENSDLSIQLHSATSFVPGQRITGSVSRMSPWVGTETTITIIFQGRCKTEFFRHDASLCRSSLELFGQDGIRVEIFHGALHIPKSPPDGRKWPFEINIPRRPSSTFLKSHPFGEASYLPLLQADWHALPPSFDLGSGAVGSSCGFAAVEYYLEATMMTSISSKPVMARIPVKLQCESSPFPITDFDIMLHSRQRYTISSPALLPAKDTVKVSIGHKVGKLLGVSKAPRLTFCLEISIASVLQKGSLCHIPLEMKAMPQWVDTSQALVHVPQVIVIHEFTLAVRSTSSVIAFETSSASPVDLVHEEHFSTRRILAHYLKPKKKKRSINKQELQYGAKSEACSLTLQVGDNPISLNLGQALDLNLQQEQFPPSEVPTFITHNIKRTYELEWKMVLEVGGETLKVKGRHPVLIMEKTDQN